MKKTISLMIVVLLVSAGAAFATDFTASGGQAITGTKTGQNAVAMGKLSNNVSLFCVYDTTTPTAFGAITKHLSGNRTFGTSYDDTRIYYKDATVGKTVTADSANQITVSDSSAWSTGWSSL